MLIKVTAEHISKGYRAHADLCPVALAVKEALPGHIVQVGCRSVFINRVEYPLSPRVNEIVYAYDIGRFTEPFEFELPVSSISNRLSELGEIAWG